MHAFTSETTLLYTCKTFKCVVCKLESMHHASSLSMHYVCMHHKNESANKHFLTLLHLPLQSLFDAAVYWERLSVGHKFFINGLLNTWRF